MVAKIQFEVNMSIKALFSNDQGEVKNILREKNQNIKKQLERRRRKKWKEFIDWPNYGYYIPNENSDEKSVIEPPQITDKVLSTDNVRSELHENATIRKGKKKSYAEIARGCSSRNNKGLNFSEKLVSAELVSTEDISKSSIYEMKINNGVGKMVLSEYSYHRRWSFRRMFLL